MAGIQAAEKWSTCAMKFHHFASCILVSAGDHVSINDLGFSGIQTIYLLVNNKNNYFRF